MRFVSIFLAPNGRISRRQFWLGHAAILAVTVVLSLVLGFVVGILSTLPGLDDLTRWGPLVIGASVGVLALAGELTLAVKRMHDRDASGIWVIAVVAVAFLANVVVGGQHVYAGESPLTPLTVGLTVFTAILGGWLVLELGFLRGSVGDNRFGTDPVTDPAVLLLDERHVAGETPPR